MTLVFPCILVNVDSISASQGFEALIAIVAEQTHDPKFAEHSVAGKCSEMASPHFLSFSCASSLDLSRFHRHISASGTKLLECQRAQQVKMTVPADSIVETLDVIEHV